MTALFFADGTVTAHSLTNNQNDMISGRPGKKGAEDMKSIRTRIMFLTVLAVVISITVATVLGALAIGSIGKSSSEQTIRMLCQTGQTNLNSYFESIEQSVGTVSSFAEHDLDGLGDEALAAHVRRTEIVFEKSAAKTNGVLTFYYRIDPSVSENVKGFWYTDLDGNGFEEHEVTDITLYDTGDTSALVWFTVPKSTGKAIWLPPYITDNLDVRVLSYNVPVYYQSTFVGVIGIEIDYSTMAEQADSIRFFGDEGYAFITDGEGRTIYYPRIEIYGEEEQPDEQIPYEMAAEGELIEYTYGGKDKEALWLPLSNGMRLHVTAPLSKINSAWPRWTGEVVIAAFLLLGLFVMIALYFAGKITTPLQKLAVAAEEVNEGNYNITLDEGGDNEIGSLNRAFNKLITRLKEYTGDKDDLARGDALEAMRGKDAFDSFLQKLQRQVNDPEGDAPEFAICFFDYNNLKLINDQYGMEKGNIALRSACTLICQTFSHSPVFRTDGDQFAAVLQLRDYENREKLISLFDRRCSDLRGMSKAPWEQVDMARGMAEFDPGRDKVVENVVRRADKAMLANKRDRKYVDN